MKNTLFTFLLLLIVQLTLCAQTEKGRWTSGVSVGSFSYESNQNQYSFTTNLTPSAGRFFSKNFLLGVGVPVTLSYSKYGTSYNSNTTLGLSPFSRYYFGNSPLKPFVGLSLAYERLNQHSESSPTITSTAKANIFQVVPSAGLAYFINQNISIDAKLSYNWSKTNFTGSDNRGTGPINTSNSYITKNAYLSIGFNIFFGQ